MVEPVSMLLSFILKILRVPFIGILISLLTYGSMTLANAEAAFLTENRSFTCHDFLTQGGRVNKNIDLPVRFSTSIGALTLIASMSSDRNLLYRARFIGDQRPDVILKVLAPFSFDVLDDEQAAQGYEYVEKSGLKDELEFYPEPILIEVGGSMVHHTRKMSIKS